MLDLIRLNKKVQYQSWHGWLLLAIVFISIVLALFQHFNPRPEEEVPVVMSQASCVEAGGSWNACGSACRGSAEPCIQVCVAECQCATNEQCPNGFVCKDFIDNSGICTKK
ncbi:MAG: hypothetical protein ABH826_02120 [Patescibacteria group bacterium]|nr:hypothetical protein [Patescibacteria group bacterium]